MQKSNLLKNFMPFHVLPHDSYVLQSKQVAITYFILIFTSAISWIG